jgi:diguanylate cyclase (GGDEF)-like protein
MWPSEGWRTTLGPTARQLRELLGVTRRMIRIVDETELLDLVCGAARECLRYEVCVVALRSDDGSFHVVATTGLSAEQDATVRSIALGAEAFEALSEAALRSGEVCFVPPEHPVWRRDDVSSATVQTSLTVPPGSWREGSILFVPLTGNDGAAIGFLNADNPMSGDLPDGEQVLLLEALAELAVVGLEMVRARAVERSATAVVEAQRRQLEALMAASAQVRGGLMLDGVLQEIAVAMTSAGGFNRAAVYVLKDGDVLECRVTVGLPPEEDSRMRRETISLQEFAPAMRPEMLMSRSYLLDHRRFELPPELDAKLNVPDVDRDWKDGQWHPLDMLTVPLTDRGGTLIGVISVDEPTNGLLPDRVHVEALEFFADQCATAVVHARDYEAARAEAQTDPLTGLANRRALEQATTSVLGIYQQLGDVTAILFIDIDHFKRVNDTFGHAVGDQVLRRVADTLRERIRQGDFLARYGGEEFVIALSGATTEDAVIIAESLRRRMAEVDFRDLCGELPVRISVGVAAATGPVAEAEALISSADAAMYEAKRRGRDQVCLSRS